MTDTGKHRGVGFQEPTFESKPQRSRPGFAQQMPPRGTPIGLNALFRLPSLTADLPVEETEDAPLPAGPPVPEDRNAFIGVRPKHTASFDPDLGQTSLRNVLEIQQETKKHYRYSSSELSGGRRNLIIGNNAKDAGFNKLSTTSPNWRSSQGDPNPHSWRTIKPAKDNKNPPSQFLSTKSGRADSGKLRGLSISNGAPLMSSSSGFASPPPTPSGTLANSLGNRSGLSLGLSRNKDKLASSVKTRKEAGKEGKEVEGEGEGEEGSTTPEPPKRPPLPPIPLRRHRSASSVIGSLLGTLPEAREAAGASPQRGGVFIGHMREFSAGQETEQGVFVDLKEKKTSLPRLVNSTSVKSLLSIVGAKKTKSGPPEEVNVESITRHTRRKTLFRSLSDDTSEHSNEEPQSGRVWWNCDEHADEKSGKSKKQEPGDPLVNRAPWEGTPMGFLEFKVPPADSTTQWSGTPMGFTEFETDVDITSESGPSATANDIRRSDYAHGTINKHDATDIRRSEGPRGTISKVDKRLWAGKPMGFKEFEPQHDVPLIKTKQWGGKPMGFSEFEAPATARPKKESPGMPNLKKKASHPELMSVKNHASIDFEGMSEGRPCGIFQTLSGNMAAKLDRNDRDDRHRAEPHGGVHFVHMEVGRRHGLFEILDVGLPEDTVVCKYGKHEDILGSGQLERSLSDPESKLKCHLSFGEDDLGPQAPFHSPPPLKTRRWAGTPMGFNEFDASCPRSRHSKASADNPAKKTLIHGTASRGSFDAYSAPSHVQASKREKSTSKKATHGRDPVSDILSNTKGFLEFLREQESKKSSQRQSSRSNSGKGAVSDQLGMRLAVPAGSGGRSGKRSKSARRATQQESYDKIENVPRGKPQGIYFGETRMQETPTRQRRSMSDSKEPMPPPSVQGIFNEDESESSRRATTILTSINIFDFTTDGSSDDELSSTLDSDTLSRLLDPNRPIPSMVHAGRPSLPKAHHDIAEISDMDMIARLLDPSLPLVSSEQAKKAGPPGLSGKPEITDAGLEARLVNPSLTPHRGARTASRPGAGVPESTFEEGTASGMPARSLRQANRASRPVPDFPEISDADLIARLLDPSLPLLPVPQNKPPPPSTSTEKHTGKPKGFTEFTQAGAPPERIEIVYRKRSLSSSAAERIIAEPQSNSPGGVARRGYLLKRGNFVKNWKRRWFILDTTEQRLYYYRSPEDATHVNFIAFEDMKEVGAYSKNTLDGKRDERCFYVDTWYRTYFFLANDEEDMQEWVQKMSAVLSNFKDEQSVPLPPLPTRTAPDTPPDGVDDGGITRRKCVLDLVVLEASGLPSRHDLLNLGSQDKFRVVVSFNNLSATTRVSKSAIGCPVWALEEDFSFFVPRWQLKSTVLIQVFMKKTKWRKDYVQVGEVKLALQELGEGHEMDDWWEIIDPAVLAEGAVSPRPTSPFQKSRRREGGEDDRRSPRQGKGGTKVVGRLRMRVQLTSSSQHSFLGHYGALSLVIPRRLNTGDVLLFSSSEILHPSTITQLFTWSMWDHCATVVLAVVGGQERLRTLEATMSGVNTYDLNKHTSNWLDNGAHVGVRRLLNVDRNPEFLQQVHKFISSVKGRPYEQNVLDLVRAAGALNREVHPTSLFCSQLVAAMYQKVGLLAGDVAANNYVPKDFGRDLPLLNGVSLEQKPRIYKLTSTHQPAK